MPQGPAKYKVKYSDADPLLPVADNWRWGRAQPCKRSGFCKGGRRTLQVCRGSLLCTNANCPFPIIEKTPNKADFIRGDRCMHCNATATETPCTARKYVENDRCHKTMTVIYLFTCFILQFVVWGGGQFRFLGHISFSFHFLFTFFLDIFRF